MELIDEVQKGLEHRKEKNYKIYSNPSNVPLIHDFYTGSNICYKRFYMHILISISYHVKLNRSIVEAR